AERMGRKDARLRARARLVLLRLGPIPVRLRARPDHVLDQAAEVKRAEATGVRGGTRLSERLFELEIGTKSHGGPARVRNPRRSKAARTRGSTNPPSGLRATAAGARVDTSSAAGRCSRRAASSNVTGVRSMARVDGRARGARPRDRRAPHGVGVVEQDAEGGRVEVVELTAAHGVDEGDDRERPQDQRDGDGHEQDTHGTGALQRVTNAEPTTLNELIGMRMAATRGLTIP